MMFMQKISLAVLFALPLAVAAADKGADKDSSTAKEQTVSMEKVETEVLSLPLTNPDPARRPSGP